MSKDDEGLYRLGGISFIVAGALFLLRYLLDLMAGPPPATGPEILAWMATAKLAVALVSEVLFFAAMFLVPAVIALYRRLSAVDAPKAAIGCGILAATIPTLCVLLILHGRLVYPMYGITASSPSASELVVSVFYGGLHAVQLMLAVATVALSLALRRAGWGNAITLLGLATAAFDVIGSYPDRVGPFLNLVSQGLLAAWFVAVGAGLYRLR